MRRVWPTVVIPARADPARPDKPRNTAGHFTEGRDGDRKRRQDQHPSPAPKDPKSGLETVFWPTPL
jgi:hypothetical protein